MKSKNLSATEGYEAWRARTLEFQKELLRVQREFKAISTMDLDLDMPLVQSYLHGLESSFEAAVSATRVATKNVSYNELLYWVGPFGAVSHIAAQCRSALEQWALFRQYPDNLSGLCVEGCVLLRKKLRPFVKVEVMEGTVRGENHFWCIKNGVVIDLTYTQFDSRASRVYVVPSVYYSATSGVPVPLMSDLSTEVQENVAAIEKYYTCESFVRRKRK